MNEQQRVDDGPDLEEVAVAAWGPEADIWVRTLEDIGIKATTERRGNWFTQLMYLGRRPVAVMVHFARPPARHRQIEGAASHLMMRVPLFPLNLVVFPGQNLPLHIFEERYKAMLQRCLRERIPFGIVLIRENGRFRGGTPHSVGTLVQVTSVEEVPEGRCSVPAPHRGSCYHITCRGTERFRVTSLDRREAEYLIAEVDPLPDERAPAPALAMVAQRVSSLFDDYYRQVIALMGGWQRETPSGARTMMFDMAALVTGQSRMQGGAEMTAEQEQRSRKIPVPSLPNDPALLANIVASELNVQTDVKQELLETPSALARLQREAEILTEETPQIQERIALERRRRFTAFGISN